MAGVKAYRLPEELRPALQRPLGRLLKGDDAYGRLLEEASRLRPPRIVAVGDVVAEDSLRHGLRLDVAIVDLKTKRRSRPIDIGRHFDHSTSVRNPPGHVTAEAIDAIREALARGAPTLIVVEGEEDLLTIPSVIYAPDGSMVIYGQPDEGVVVVDVNEGSRGFFRGLLESFTEVEV